MYMEEEKRQPKFKEKQQKYYLYCESCRELQ